MQPAAKAPIALPAIGWTSFKLVSDNAEGGPRSRKS
jgi:hypothetical protein